MILGDHSAHDGTRLGWLAIALTGGGRAYPEAEHMLRIAAHFARSASVVYVEPPKRDATVTGIGLAGT